MFSGERVRIMQTWSERKLEGRKRKREREISFLLYAIDRAQR